MYSSSGAMRCSHVKSQYARGPVVLLTSAARWSNSKAVPKPLSAIDGRRIFHTVTEMLNCSSVCPPPALSTPTAEYTPALAVGGTATVTHSDTVVFGESVTPPDGGSISGSGYHPAPQPFI